MNIQELLSRYNLTTRPALYNRLDFLCMKLSKDSNGKAFATNEQLKELDDLHKHIKAGNRMSTFLKPSNVEILDTPNEHITRQSSRQSTKQFTRQYSEQSNRQSSESISSSNIKAEELLEVLVGAIALSINPQNNTLEKYRVLDECRSKSWLLTSKDIQQILGQRPRRKKGCNHCVIGGWRFNIVTKSGNQYLWNVSRAEFHN
ncbi:hypothetical protein [Okeania sp. SIO1I7]|uniref:hypothetical protein n=1 Tax=Okeania sp. SIO1I7 TaxID=2607772 RepID=UPI0013FA8010|nr:hypothetical protein [Okeania sp. SIO1I7]NET30255.1 hypothetical protein [Okeania sp. SIO1I7]